MGQLLNRQIAKLLVTLELFHWYSQFHKHTYIGVGGDGEPQSSGQSIKIVNSQMASGGAIFSSTGHTN